MIDEKRSMDTCHDKKSKTLCFIPISQYSRGNSATNTQ